ncbi:MULTISPECIES: SPOR domain-containing protein [Sphingomonas]|jgi:Flp pilus assembly protein TadD|uniref:SPOR domain-containing protein n=1 Tax=Sphingomonas TaxID=13687 RepID=UPI001AE2B1DE
MKTRSAITFGPLTLGVALCLAGGTLAAVTTATIAAASARAQSRAEKQGRDEFAAAQAALSHGKFDVAIRHAEAAVGDQPQVAAYRLLLGQSYLKGGRFASARDVFADVLTLDDGNGKVALNLALAQIATGDWAGARKTLDTHAATIPVADRGLAIALAGDPATAVEVLGPAARAPEADAKIRQNFALSLALAGRWREAQTVVAMDVAPADVARRILDWSTFSRPTSASDQVATLLGVTPVVDPGLPVALALNGRPAATAMAATEAPVDAFMPGKPEVAPAPTPAPVAVAAVEPDAKPVVGPSIAGVVFAERKEVVQALPVAVANTRAKHGAVAPRAAVAVAVTSTPRAVAKGSFYVQLGAYQTAGVAHDAWGRVSRRFAGFAGHTPQGMSVTTKGKSFYRLSVGGFARGDAVALCLGYRATGGSCFVRAGAGDQVAMWAKGRELASR